MAEKLLVMDFVNTPLDAVQTLFETHQSKGYKNEIINYFKSSLQNSTHELLNKIPSMNDVPLHNLKSQTLVKFRCMIQDMFDPEYYMEAFEVKDGKSGTSSMRCGMYRDVTDDVEVDLDSPKNIAQDRLMYYCISVPAENDWVKQKYAEKNCSEAFAKVCATQSSCNAKRTLVDDAMDGNATEQLINGSAMDTDEVSVATATCSKRVKTSEAGSHGATSISTIPEFNLPIPDPSAVTCIAKVYDRADSYSLNDVVEFIGILSLEPLLTNTYPENICRAEEGGEVDTMDFESRNAYSFVPRLHVVTGLKLKHNNPLLPVRAPLDTTNADVCRLLSECGEIRTHLHSIFEQAFWGDSLVADYIICHLISTVYLHKDVVALGKFSLNVSNVFNVDDYTKCVYHLIETLTTKSHLLPLSIEHLNMNNFTPVKDYTKNRLRSGLLQLTAHTHLIVDETALTSGNLDSKGVKNITALGNLLQWQKVEYDFNFHHLSFEADIPVLVLSEGKSLVTADCVIPVQMKGAASCTKQMFSAIDNYLTPDLLARIRCYISLLRLMEYKMSDDLQKLVQSDFVEKRQEHAASMKTDDLHTLIVLARLLSLSYGQTILSEATWERAKEMEAERKARILPR